MTEQIRRAAKIRKNVLREKQLETLEVMSFVFSAPGFSCPEASSRKVKDLVTKFKTLPIGSTRKNIPLGEVKKQVIPGR